MAPMNDLAALSYALTATAAAAEARGSLDRALPAMVPLAFVGLMFAGRELLLLALDQETNNARRHSHPG